MKGTLELTGMEFHAFHGCLPEEREQGNLFLVDFSAEIDVAPDSDDLAGTVDYGAVYDVVAAQMAEPSNLIEHVCARIVRALEAAFPQLEDFSVSVAKRNPPVAGPAAWSRITIRHGRE